MAKIPTYDTLQIAPQGLPGARQNIRGITPSAFGAGTGEAIQRGANMAAAIYKQKKAEDDVTAAQEAYQAYKRDHIEYQTGARERLGSNAFGLTGEMQKFSDERYRHYIGGLSEGARKHFDARVPDVNNQYYQWAGGHESQQRGIHQTTVYQSGVQTERQAAINNPTNEQFADSVGEIRAYHQREAELKGYDQEWVANKTQEDMDAVHAAILNSAIQGGEQNLQSVQTWIKDHGEGMSAPIRDKAQSWVKEVELGNQAFTYANESYESGLPVQEAINQVDEKTLAGLTVSERDKYVQRIQSTYALKEREKAKVIEQQVFDLDTTAYNDGFISLPDSQIDDLAANDPARAIRYKDAKATALKLAAGGVEHPKFSNESKLAEVTRLISDNMIRTKEQLASWKPFLSSKHFNDVQKTLEDRKTVSNREIEEAYKRHMSKKGRKDADWGDEDWADYFMFQKLVLDRTDQFARNDVEIMAAQWHLGVEHDGSGWLWDDTTKAGKLLSQGIISAEQFQTLIDTGRLQDPEDGDKAYRLTDSVTPNVLINESLGAYERDIDNAAIVSKLPPADREAYDWAMMNLHDPKAKHILNGLGIK